MVLVIKKSEPVKISRSTAPIKVQRSELFRITPAQPVRIIPSAISVITVAPARPTIVLPPPRGAWDERGWTRRTESGREIYEGFFQVGPRRFRGRIQAEHGGNRVSAYIHNPPPEIKRHRHSACFQQGGVGTGWFILHWHRAPTNVDDAILYMENVLYESLNN